ncbi:hypothetical protein ACFYY8_18040 [Streptosporangium sp. NPDC001559]|uniref:hypothetical protein n=1 Tax=Streptosporangium sp. NPDC001559 TaxID=3366187 RepID=UPI0036EE0206
MVMRLLWEPLPQSWPKVAPERSGGLRGLPARIREMAAVVRHYDDFERRMRREAMPVVVASRS